MRLDHDDSPWCSTHNPFDGAVGRALYVSAAGVTDAADIRYRNLRLLSAGPASVCDQFPALGDGPLGLDAHVALAKNSDALTWTLPAAYLTSSFVVNVRPHKSGLELDTISGWQSITTASGEDFAGVLGTALVIETTKLDGGGLRVWFRYYPTAEGQQPTTFEIQEKAVTPTIATVGVIATADHNYYVELAGLANATAYTFAIVGLVNTAAKELTTFAVTGDNAAVAWRESPLGYNRSGCVQPLWHVPITLWLRGLLRLWLGYGVSGSAAVRSTGTQLSVLLERQHRPVCQRHHSPAAAYSATAGLHRLACPESKCPEKKTRPAVMRSGAFFVSRRHAAA